MSCTISPHEGSQLQVLQHDHGREDPPSLSDRAMPKRAMRWDSTRSMRWPSKVTEPRRTRPITVRKVVVFPARWPRCKRRSFRALREKHALPGADVAVVGVHVGEGELLDRAHVKTNSCSQPLPRYRPRWYAPRVGGRKSKPAGAAVRPPAGAGARRAVFWAVLLLPAAAILFLLVVFARDVIQLRGIDHAAISRSLDIYLRTKKGTGFPPPQGFRELQLTDDPVF